jgi:hypothetical protein
MARLPAKTSSIVIEPKMSIKSDLEKRIDSLIEDALPYFRSIFKQVALANPQNATILCEFIVAERDEHNIKLSSRLTRIKIIYLFNRYLDYKSFEQITKDDVVGYLVSLKKSESQPFIKPIVNPIDILLVSGIPKFDIIASAAAVLSLSLIVLVVIPFASIVRVLSTLFQFIEAI